MTGSMLNGCTTADAVAVAGFFAAGRLAAGLFLGCEKSLRQFGAPWHSRMTR